MASTAPTRDDVLAILTASPVPLVLVQIHTALPPGSAALGDVTRHLESLAADGLVNVLHGSQLHPLGFTASQGIRSSGRYWYPVALLDPRRARLAAQQEAAEETERTARTEHLADMELRRRHADEYAEILAKFREAV